MTPIRTLARPMLASMFVVGAVNALKNSEPVARRAKPVTDRVVTLANRVAPGVPLPSNPETLVRINAGAQLFAAAALVSGRAPRLGAAILAGSLVPTTFAGHPFWEETDPEARAAQKIHFFKNVSMFGGTLIAAVDTGGKPGVAWRARHTADDVRRQARHLRRTAKLEAKLAAKNIT
jgi:uncharacterized membrane protein YphA (DoxX/SURF4 family)